MADGVGPDCNLCGEATDGSNGREWVGSARDPTGDRFFRHAVVCTACLERRVLPWLRWLFRGGPENHNLNRPPGDGPRDAADVLEPGDPDAHFVFGSGGRLHAAREVLAGPPYGDRAFCVAYCGVSGFHDPEPELGRLSSAGEPCRRCLETAPRSVAGGPP